METPVLPRHDKALHIESVTKWLGNLQRSGNVPRLADRPRPDFQNSNHTALRSGRPLVSRGSGIQILRDGSGTRILVGGRKYAGHRDADQTVHVGVSGLPQDIRFQILGTNGFGDELGVNLIRRANQLRPAMDQPDGLVIFAERRMSSTPAALLAQRGSADGAAVVGNRSGVTAAVVDPPQGTAPAAARKRGDPPPPAGRTVVQVGIRA